MPTGAGFIRNMAAAGALMAFAGGCMASRQARVEPMARPAPDSGPGRAPAPSAWPAVAPAGTAGLLTGEGGGDAGPASAAAITTPVPDSVVAATPPPITWDLAVESNAARTRVAYFADVFTGRARPAFELALARQTRFAGVIGDRLRAGGLPLDLTYLALIESWYNPDAYSKAAAVGMWQFMAGTARGVGLRVDWWIDERRDPVRSTEGAVRLLKSLHDDFGSFFLAAAAYNGGSGRVSRGLTQFATRVEPFEGEDRFFALSDTRSLRPETRDYVPKMIAAALVAKQPERYGLHVDSLPPFTFDSVLAPGGAPLAAIAAAAPADVATIADLNPRVLRGMLPKGDALWVRVPKGTADGFDGRYTALDPVERASHTTVVSKKGESMASIARRHKLTAKQLNWYNPKVSRLKSGNLVPGQTIVVPSAAVAAAARDVPNPSIERYPRRRSAAVKASARTSVKASGKASAKAAAKAPATSPAKPLAKAPSSSKKR